MTTHEFILWLCWLCFIVVGGVVLLGLGACLLMAIVKGITWVVLSTKKEFDRFNNEEKNGKKEKH